MQKAGLEKKATTKTSNSKETNSREESCSSKSICKIKSWQKKVTVKIKKASVSGYQIKYASNKNFKKQIQEKQFIQSSH